MDRNRIGTVSFNSFNSNVELPIPIKKVDATSNFQFQELFGIKLPKVKNGKIYIPEGTYLSIKGNQYETFGNIIEYNQNSILIEIETWTTVTSVETTRVLSFYHSHGTWTNEQIEINIKNFGYRPQRYYCRFRFVACKTWDNKIIHYLFTSWHDKATFRDLVSLVLKMHGLTFKDLYGEGTTGEIKIKNILKNIFFQF